MLRYIYLFLAFLSLVIGIIYLNDLHKEVEDKTMSQLLKQQEIFAVQAAEGIESFFENCKNSLKYIAKQKDIINFSEKTHDELIKFFMSFEGQITAVSRVDKNGILVDTYPKSNSIGKDLSNQKHNQLLIKEQRPVISDVIEVVQGYKAVVYSYPVWKDGEYNGAIGILIPYKYIANKFLQKIKIGTGGYAFMISENGIELYYPFDAHVGSSIFNNAQSNPSVLKLAEKMLEAKPGTTEYSFQSGLRMDMGAEDKLAFYYPIRLENTFWSIAVVISKNEVMEVNQGFNRVFIIVVVIITTIIVILVSLYFYSKRKADLILKAKEEKYGIIIEQTGQIVYHHNFIANTIQISGALKEVTGYTREINNPFSYKELLELVHPDDRKKVVENSEQARKKGVNFSQVYRFKHADGHYIYVEDHGTCLRRSNNECDQLVGTIKDISDRIKVENLTKQKNKELEEIVKERTEELNEINIELQKDILKRKKTEGELKIAKAKAEKSDKLKSEFLAQMSHEIRTPVNSLLSFSNLIREETKDKIDESLKEGFEVIDKAGRRITRTIDLILNMSQIQTGSYEANYQEFDIQDRIIANIKNEYQKIARDKGLKLKVTGMNGGRNLYADEYTVFQIFTNLVDNAVKYTHEGEIEIMLHPENEKELKVDIIDTGIGIAEEYIPHLFTAFTQEQQGYTRKYDGNGLGLALVKKYCEINKADIQVESEKGKGTKFTITFNDRRTV